MKILGFNYMVVEEGDIDSIGACGRFHAKSQKIQIAEDLCEEQKISTILHETIEALNYHLELEIEHRAIMALDATLYQVLRDNGVDLTPLLDNL